MDSQDEMPAPGLSEVFKLRLVLGNEYAIGRLATGGQRIVVPVQSGVIQSADLDATITSGSETCLTRKDGVTTVEAVYLLSTADGATVRMIGTGMKAAGSGFDGIRMTIVFEVDEVCAHAWLATRAFVAERAEGSDTLTIFQIT